MVVAKALLLLPTLAAAKSIWVFGHKAPDTDAVTSAMVYAWELNELKVPAEAFRLGDLNPETEFVLKELGVQPPHLLHGGLSPEALVAVVDTNNPDELPEGITKARIHSIVDHHKLGGLTNSEPLTVDMRTLCSATSILYSRATAAGLKITKPIAGLMLAGILSDSLGFRSPTTTEMDKKHAEELAVLAGLNMTAFFDGMLNAKAKVGQMSPMELLKLDSKIYTIGGEKLRVSVIETTRPTDVLNKKVSLVHAMRKMVEDEKLDDVLFFVIDITQETALFLSGSKTASAMIEKAWHVWVDENTGVAILPGVLSRKKQIIPALEAATVARNEVNEL